MKKIITILISVLIVVLCILLIVLLIQYKSNSEIHDKLQKQEEEYLNGINNPGLLIEGIIPEKVTIDNIFFSVESCIKTYIEHNIKNNQQAIYSLIDYKYINEKNISLENIGEYIKTYENSEINKTIEIYEVTGSTYYTYYAKHKLGSDIIYLIVNTDTATNSFSVIPIEKLEYEKKIIEPAEAFGNQEDSVKKNEYNTISYKYYEEADIVDKYFQDYLESALLDPEYAYNLLDKEYRESKFENLNEYTEYISNNKEKFELMCKSQRKQYTDFENYKQYEEYYKEVSKNGIEEYKIETNETGKKMNCKDNYGNHYIFNINSIMNYTVIPDTYSIDLPEFIEEYEEANSYKKVALNIQKIVSAINSNDYKYVYDKLDETFKQTNFKTVDELKNYIEENLYTNNVVSYEKCENIGDIFVYSITISDGNNVGKNISKDIVMKLLEGTDFVMSFNVD